MPIRPTPASRRTVQAGVGTAVGLGVATAILLFAAMTMVSTWMRSRERAPFGSGAFPTRAARDVEVWVGQLSPGVKGVLSSEWNEALWDERQDAILNGGLGLTDGQLLAFYSLVVFNTSGAAVKVRLTDGSLLVTPVGGETLRSHDLAALFAGPTAPSSPQAAVLRSLGADREVVDVPPGKMARQPVALAKRVNLATFEGVVTVDGMAFHRRRIPQKAWAGLLHSPSVEDIENL